MPGGHLLVIDDSPTVLKVIELALSEAGYVVSTAPDDDAGLTLVREARTVPDLILLDGLIPNRDAAEICRRFASDAGARAGARGRDGGARPGRRSGGALRQGVQRRRLHRQAVCARRPAGRGLTCRRQTYVGQVGPDAGHAFGRGHARIRGRARRGRRGAVALGGRGGRRGPRLRRDGPGAGGRPGCDFDERDPRDAGRAGTERHPAGRQHGDQRPHRDLFPRRPCRLRGGGGRRRRILARPFRGRRRRSGARAARPGAGRSRAFHRGGAAVRRRL